MGSTPWAKSPSFECVKFSIILGAVQTPTPSLNAFAIKVPRFIAKAGFLDRMISTVSTLAVTLSVTTSAQFDRFFVYVCSRGTLLISWNKVQSGGQFNLPDS
jgi:hypothetical protein